MRVSGILFCRREGEGFCFHASWFGGRWRGMVSTYEALEHVDRLSIFPGIVMVADTGEVVYQKSFGFADHQ
jgi:hypothetical protein